MYKTEIKDHNHNWNKIDHKVYRDKDKSQIAKNFFKIISQFLRNMLSNEHVPILDKGL